MSAAMTFGVRGDFAKPALQCVPCDEAVRERHADIAQYRRIGEIALPARNRQFGGEVMQQRIGDAEVAFRIFEIDGVDLVRHGRGTDFARHGALAQVAEGNVAPAVTREIDENGVDGGKRVAVLAYPVVRFDLRGVLVQDQALRLDESAADRGPVDLRQRRDMRVVVADGAIPLREDFHLVETGTRAAQARHHVGSSALVDCQGERGGGVPPGPARPCRLDSMMSRWIVVLIVVTLAGCSPKKMGISRMADALTSTASAFTRDNDPEFVRQAAPSTLKMVEMMLDQSPTHPGLLMTACSGFTRYAYAFLQSDADVSDPLLRAPRI